MQKKEMQEDIEEGEVLSSEEIKKVEEEKRRSLSRDKKKRHKSHVDKDHKHDKSDKKHRKRSRSYKRSDSRDRRHYKSRERGDDSHYDRHRHRDYKESKVDKRCVYLNSHSDYFVYRRDEFTKTTNSHHKHTDELIKKQHDKIVDRN